MKKILKVLLGLVVSGLFLYLLLRDLDYASLGGVVGTLNPVWVLLGVILFYLGYTVRTLRWACMLRTENTSLTLWQVQGPFYASIALNNVLPFRLGDAARLFAFNRYLNISLTLSVSSLVVERCLDLLVLVVLCALGCYLCGLDLVALFGDLIAALLLVVATLIGALILYPGFFHAPALWCLNLAGRLLPGLAAKLTGAAEKVFAALELIVGSKRKYTLLLLSFISWTAEGLVFYCCARALPNLIGLKAVLASFPCATLATLIPSSPGYIGTFDYFGALPMVLAGNGQAEAAVFALLTHLLLLLCSTLVGALFFSFSSWRHSLGFWRSQA